MAEVIRLLDSSGTRVLDSVSAEYEDSFCLDEFGDLIKMHAEVEPKGTKCFIIARVQTWDHKQPDKAFYSYYNAYHLNKILFQTQVYLGKKLIHRLHVLNPLTNTDIIGNVQYFMVKPSGMPVGKTQAPSAKTAGSDEGPQILSTAIVIDKSPTLASPASAQSKRPSFSMNIRKKQGPTLSPINTTLSSSGKELPPPSPSVKEVEQGSATSWTMAGPKVADISTEDGLSPASAGGLQNFVRKMSYSLSPRRESTFADAARRGSSRNQPAISPATVPARSPSSIYSNPFEENAMRKRAISLNEGPTQDPEVPQSRRNTAYDFDAIVKQPTGPIYMSPDKQDQNKVVIPPGSVTRFAVPVPTKELLDVLPKTAKNRRRSLSYVNAVTAAGTKATFEEWLAMVQEDEHGKEGEEEGDYDIVKPFGTPVKGLIQEEGEDEKVEVITDVDKLEPESPKKKVESANNVSVITYNAILFATDNDFLESSKMRAIFKENSLQPEDCVLFEMPPFTGQEESPIMIIVDEPQSCEWCYPSERTLRDSSPFMKAFHRSKCYVAALMLMLALFFL
ncbi:hypothetical protein HDU76_006735 [Blyttiomyces sp. JEL0837]|nr:hypothetical protein HDU76_006735 [Blyttiomyces sp. JEL0837]